MNTIARRSLPAALALIALTLPALSACGNELQAPRHIENKTADTGKAAKAEKLAPDWLPDDARDVRVERRTTGDERILVATYSGTPATDSCTTIAERGKPTHAELAEAYASDTITRTQAPKDFTKTSTLEASWWPEGQEAQTTALCGRWWVSVQHGRLYAFAPELTTVADTSS